MDNFEILRLLSEVAEATGDYRTFFDYPKKAKIHNVSRTLPPIIRMYRETIGQMERLREGDVCEICGYLEPEMPVKRIPNSWTEKYGVNSPFNVFKLCAEPTKIDTGAVVLAPGVYKITTMMPYIMKLKFVGLKTPTKRVFWLVDEPEPTVARLSGIEKEIPTLSYNGLMKAFGEAMPMLNPMSKTDQHTIKAVAANYIGCDFVKGIVDGIGSSYVKNGEIMHDLERIDSAIQSPRYGLPLSHVGVITCLHGSFPEIRTYREKLSGKLKSIGWNIPSESGTLENMRGAEFKYSPEISLIPRDYEKKISDNIDLNLTLISLSLKPKLVKSEEDFKLLLSKVRSEIEHRTVGGRKNRIEKLFDLADIGIQTGRLYSFHSSFGFDSVDIQKIVMDTTINNIESILENEEVVKKLLPTEHLRGFEEEIPDKFIFAVEQSGNRDRQAIIENMIKLTGASEKIANKLFNDMWERGVIYTPDNGKTFYLAREKYYKFERV